MALRNSSDPMDILEALAMRAREEHAPRIDVSDEVLRRLRTPVNPVDRGLLYLTAGAMTAAALVIAMSYPSFTEAFDPLASMMEDAASSLI